MPDSKHDAEEQPLLDSSSLGNSVETSTTTSPTTSRSFSNIRQHRTFLLPSSSDLTTRFAEGLLLDERAPLLGSRHSRVKITDGTTPKPRLSRHQSASGISPISPSDREIDL
jgi:hypothetical protein